MKELTRKQKSILDFINSYLEKHSCSPSFNEIKSRFGFASPNAVTKHLRALAKKGFLLDRQDVRKYKHRAITPLRAQAEGVPLLGTIAAGKPLEAVENIEARVDLSPLGIASGKGDYFMLRVRGNSMVNAHILNGDMVVVRRQEHADPADIAAVLWNNEATLKYVTRSGKNIVLRPANDAMEPIVVAPEKTASFKILGVFAGLVRKG